MARKNKNKLILLISVAIVLLFVGALVFVGISKRNSAMNNQTTTNWRTYQSTIYNYTVEYPNNLSIEAFCGKTEEILITPENINCAPGSYGVNVYRIIVYNGDMIASLTNSTPDAINHRSTNYTNKNITFNNLKANDISWTNNNGELLYEQILFIKDNKTYRIENIPVNNFSESKTIFDQVLSNFRLLH